jgi:hypothetical protein
MRLSYSLRLVNNSSMSLCVPPVASCPADLAPRLSGGQLGYARPRTQDSSFSLDGGAFEGEGQGPDAAGAVWCGVCFVVACHCMLVAACCGSLGCCLDCRNKLGQSQPTGTCWHMSRIVDSVVHVPDICQHMPVGWGCLVLGAGTAPRQCALVDGRSRCMHPSDCLLAAF